MRFRRRTHEMLLVLAAVVCVAVTLYAAENAPAPNASPTVLNRKEGAQRNVAHPVPDYPPIAKVNYLEGSVLLELRVNKMGNVTTAHVLNGDAVLAVAALKAARQWVYQPLPTGDGPAGFITTVRIKFTLRHPEVQLTPHQAERDFLRQVKPPQIDHPTGGGQPGEVVHIRVLVDEQGRVVDTDVLSADTQQAEAARRSLRDWTFQPAHWGGMAVPSYLDVDVPVTAPAITRAAVTPVGN